MELDNLIKIAENTPAYKQKLLRKEHITYCLAIHQIIGTQTKVMYNAMGPDISTVLYTTNANEIIGIDVTPLKIYDLEEYVRSYWNIIEKKPVETAVGFAYNHPNYAVNDYKSDKDKSKQFKRSQELRLKEGYWDMSCIWAWSVERLLAIELKKIGVKPKDIILDSDKSEITFKWAFPGEELKERKLKYSSIPVSDKYFKYTNQDIDCFYQKSLPQQETKTYIEKILPNMNNNAIFIIGYVDNFQRYQPNKNKLFRREIQKTLGRQFKSIKTDNINSIVDNVFEGSEAKNDPNTKDGTYEYGMKLHLFQKRKNLFNEILNNIMSF